MSIQEAGTMPGKKKGFTLIEIMVVIGILGIVLGMAVFAGTKARTQSKIAKAKADIAGLEVAISMYQVDMGAYPNAGNQSLVNALAYSGDKGSVPDWHGPYIEFDKENLNGTMPTATFQDSWNNNYVYIKPGTHNPSYDIYSQGPNGVGDGTGEDDINNW